ncbi:MAG TPA: hypothetical protein VMH83_10075 [Candidatus Acidoferrum sp.]|nr:hypothetical protein [Candidatus Acidoferrum sp.]
MPIIRLFSKLTLDDEVVRTIFDHFRNLTVIGTLFAAATWKQMHVGNFMAGWWDMAASLVLDLTGFALAWLNHAHLQVRLRSLQAPRWIEFSFYAFYAFGIAEVFRYIRGG